MSVKKVVQKKPLKWSRTAKSITQRRKRGAKQILDEIKKKKEAEERAKSTMPNPLEMVQSQTTDIVNCRYFQNGQFQIIEQGKEQVQYNNNAIPETKEAEERAKSTMPNPLEMVQSQTEVVNCRHFQNCQFQTIEQGKEQVQYNNNTIPEMKEAQEHAISTIPNPLEMLQSLTQTPDIVNYRHFRNGRIIEQGKERVKRRRRSRKNAIPETKEAEEHVNYRHFRNGRIIEQGKERVKRRRRSRKNAIPETHPPLTPTLVETQSAMNALETSVMEQPNVMNLGEIEVNRDNAIDIFNHMRLRRRRIKFIVQEKKRVRRRKPNAIQVKNEVGSTKPSPPQMSKCPICSKSFKKLILKKSWNLSKAKRITRPKKRSRNQTLEASQKKKEARERVGSSIPNPLQMTKDHFRCRHFSNGQYKIIKLRTPNQIRTNAIPESSTLVPPALVETQSAMEQPNVIIICEDETEVEKQNAVDGCSVENQHIVETPVDLASQLGKFGWQEIERTVLPYLTRSNDLRVVSKRMAHVKVIHEMEEHLSYEVLSCMDKNELEATAAEAKLLTDINKNHSDKRFGREPFKRGDPMILLSDLEEMVMFMRYGCVVSSKQPSVNGNRCGYMKLGLETVPYVLSDNKRYLPLFYFGGDIELLQKRAVKLDGWKLTYIRLLCKIKGVNEKYFEGRSMDCVELEHLKKFLPLGTTFEETWPSENKLHHNPPSLDTIPKIPSHSKEAPKTMPRLIRALVYSPPTVYSSNGKVPRLPSPSVMRRVQARTFTPPTVADLPKLIPINKASHQTNNEL